MKSIISIVFIRLMYLPANPPFGIEDVGAVLKHNIGAGGLGGGLWLQEQGNLEDPHTRCSLDLD